MKTYYQKHRTIKAFQFDGTWYQLYKELPMDLFTGLCEYDKSDIFKLDYTFTSTHYINSIQTIRDGWPIHNGNDKNPYFIEGTKLHLHDYVVIYYQPMAYKQDSISRSSNHVTWIETTQLKFYRPWDFTAHWSKYPLKKK